MKKDKKLHLAAGALIAATVAMLAAAVTSSAPAAIYAGLASGAVAGLVKEYADRAHGCKFDFADLAVTLLGALLGSMAGWLAPLAA